MANQLHGHVVDMLETESKIEDGLRKLSGLLGNQGEFSDAIGGLRTIAKSQRDRLEERLKSIPDSDLQAGASASSASTTVSGPKDESARPSASMALQEIYAALSRAAFGYGLLHTRAHRFFDGSPEGSTGDVAQRHSQAYKEAAQQIFEMAPDIAIWELDGEGQPCICKCPSCSLGICLCWHTHSDGKPGGPDDRGIRIRTPKPESDAERIGLRDGDIILSVAGQTITTYDDVNPVLNKHDSGDEVVLQVQRVGGGPWEVTATRP